MFRGDIMNINRYILIVIVLLMSSCGGGGGPTAPVIIPPAVGSGGGTATGPAGTVANGATFDIQVDADIDVPIRYAQIIVTFQPSLMTTVPTVDITSGLFNSLVSATFFNGSAASGKLYIVLENSPTASSTGPGKLCTITFTNSSGAGIQTSTIAFSGSTVVFETSPASESPMVIGSVDVSLG